MNRKVILHYGCYETRSPRLLNEEALVQELLNVCPKTFLSMTNSNENFRILNFS